MLRTPLAAALLFYLKKADGALGLPEVVEMELARQVVRAGREASESAEGNFRILQQILGTMPEFRLPTEEQLQEAVSQRLAELAPLIRRVPFTLEHARSSLNRVASAQPPSSPKNQQFKDSAIWEAVLELATDTSVIFVTGDRGFFRARDPAAGLAPELGAELEASGLAVQVVPALRNALPILQTSAPPLDTTRLAGLLDDALRGDLEEVVGRRGMALGTMAASSVRAYATERHERIALTFELTYNLDDPNESERQDATTTTSGDAEYDPGNDSITEYRFAEVVTRWRSQAGETLEFKDVYGRGVAVVGHKKIPLVIREEVL